MRINRSSMTPDQDEDTTKYHFAQGSLLLRGLADRVSEIFHSGRPIGEYELRGMHTDLKDLWNILTSETLDGTAPAGGAANPSAVARYRATYTDGTCVALLLDVEDSASRVPLHFRESAISHLPAPTGEDRHVDTSGGHSKVRVELPPHKRPAKKGGRNRGGVRRNSKSAAAPAPTLRDVSALRARLEAHT
jgi:hypothetical protein